MSKNAAADPLSYRVEPIPHPVRSSQQRNQPGASFRPIGPGAHHAILASSLYDPEHARNSPRLQFCRASTRPGSAPLTQRGGAAASGAVCVARGPAVPAACPDRRGSHEARIGDRRQAKPCQDHGQGRTSSLRYGRSILPVILAGLRSAPITGMADSEELR